MNLDAIEILLVAKLKSLLGKQVDVLSGPVAALALGGMRETIFVHAARFRDYNGVTADGASICRRPIRNGRIVGIAEERPCMIEVEIDCISMAYARVKALSYEITPTVLLALACEREFMLGSTANQQCMCKFTDYQSNLNQAETFRQDEDAIVFHRERLIFQMNGFLHLLLSKYGGLKKKTTSIKKPRAKKIKL